MVSWLLRHLRAGTLLSLTAYQVATQSLISTATGSMMITQTTTDTPFVRNVSYLTATIRAGFICISHTKLYFTPQSERQKIND